MVRTRPGHARSDVHRARSAGPLRLLTPRAAGNAAWIVTSSLGGGLVDGDEVELELEVDRDATCVVATQASTKAFRGRSYQTLRARVAAGGALLVVPDPLVAFRDASVRQHTRLELAATADLVLVDIVTAGRLAHGERWDCARLDTQLTIVRDGATRLHDRILLDRADGPIAARMQRFVALATCVVEGPRVANHAAAILEHVRGAPFSDRELVIVASPFGAGVVIRIAGTSIERVISTLRARVLPACTVLGEDPWARKW
ncbi:MAG TPA: urease accessory protein UreD [Kofleriaceae bacterium]|nr:urease accessory protein UreD [Kofleriaceae bacterium]